MKALLLFSFLLFPILSQGQVRAKIDISPKGEYLVTINTVVHNLENDEIIKNLFLDQKKIVSVSNLTRSMDVKYKNNNDVYILTTSTKNMQTKKVGTNCKLKKATELDCKVDVDNYSGAGLFHYSEFNIKCINNVCDLNFRGHPKAFSYLVVKRSSPTLAIGGVVELLNDYVKLILLNNNSLISIQDKIDIIYKDGVQTLDASKQFHKEMFF